MGQELQAAKVPKPPTDDKASRFLFAKGNVLELDSDDEDEVVVVTNWHTKGQEK